MVDILHLPGFSWHLKTLAAYSWRTKLIEYVRRQFLWNELAVQPPKETSNNNNNNHNHNNNNNNNHNNNNNKTTTTTMTVYFPPILSLLAEVKKTATRVISNLVTWPPSSHPKR